ncbi:MAG: hypothetical protein ACOCY0_04460 [Roseicyclus sp.]
MTNRSPGTSAQEEPDRAFDDPLSIVNRQDLGYETRLHMLQTWLARLARGDALRGSREEVEGAIFALQSRSKLKQDTPEEQPQTTTYGGVERSNLRRDAMRRMIARWRGYFR